MIDDGVDGYDGCDFFMFVDGEGLGN